MRVMTRCAAAAHAHARSNNAAVHCVVHKALLVAIIITTMVRVILLSNYINYYNKFILFSSFPCV